MVAAEIAGLTPRNESGSRATALRDPGSVVKLLEGKGARHGWPVGLRGWTVHRIAGVAAGRTNGRGDRCGEEERKGEKKALTSGTGMSAAGALRGRGLLGWRWSRAELRQCGLENRGGAGPWGRKRREGAGRLVGLLGWFQGLVFYFPFLFLFLFQTYSKLFEFK